MVVPRRKRLFQDEDVVRLRILGLSKALAEREAQITLQKKQRELAFRPWKPITVTFLAILIVYSECKLLLNAFQSLPLTFACYLGVYSFALYSIVNSDLRWIFLRWLFGSIAWNAPIFLFKYFFGPANGEINDQHIGFIFFGIVLRNTLHIIYGYLMEFLLNRVGVRMSLCYCDVCLPLIPMQYVLLRRSLLPPFAFLRLLLVVGVIVTYENLTLLHLYDFLPLRFAVYLLVSLVTFRFLIVYPDVLIDWSAGWAAWNAPFLVFWYMYGNLDLPPEKSRYDDDLGFILLFTGLRSIGYTILGKVVVANWIRFMDSCGVVPEYDLKTIDTQTFTCKARGNRYRIEIKSSRVVQLPHGHLP